MFLVVVDLRKVINEQIRNSEEKSSGNKNVTNFKIIYNIDLKMSIKKCKMLDQFKIAR